MNTGIDRQNTLRVAVVGRNLEDLLPILAQFPRISVVDSEPELVISYGGDGSLLGAERQYPGIPKFPLRDSRQNPKCQEHGEVAVIQRLLDGKLKCTPLLKLSATFPDGQCLCGINDIVIAHNDVRGAIRYEVTVNNTVLRQVVIADSLLASTPFGSTGYFQSVTHGNFSTGIGLAFPGALDFYNYTILEPSAVIEVRLLRGPATVVADNNPTVFPLKDGEVVRIEVLPEFTLAYGIDVFRCQECFRLRQHPEYVRCQHTT